MNKAAKPDEYEPSTVEMAAAIKAAVNFVVATCLNHMLYLQGQNASAEEVGICSVLGQRLRVY